MKTDLGKYLIEKLNTEQSKHKDRLAYCRLHWNGRSIFAPPRLQNLDPETLINMPVQIVYFMNGKLHTEEYDNLLSALSGMYSHHVWGMAMFGRTSDGKNCLRYESASAYEQLSQ